MKSLFLTIFVFFGLVTFAQGAGENVNAVGQRPMVLMDEAHFNYPLVEASDKPFAAFLQKNEYRVSSLTVPFEKESLDTGQVLIIAMPLAHQITDETRSISVNGWFQGAVSTFGQGRAAFFGEAGMFFAVIRSLSESDDCGDDCWTSVAEQNPQLLLNVLGWLSEFHGISF